jgi:hypothetical protein
MKTHGTQSFTSSSYASPRVLLTLVTVIRRSHFSLLTAMLWLVCSLAASAATFTIRFSQESYVAQRGSLSPFIILIDPIPASGLFSFGIRVTYDPALGP